MKKTNNEKKNVKDNEPKGAFTLIWKNEKEIKRNVKKIHDYIKILNDNYNRVKEINPYLSERITFLHSFYRHDNVSSSTIKRMIKEELRKCLESENPYNNSTMVDEVANELMNKLHFNCESELLNGCKQLSKEGTNGNLKTININDKSFCERYITFDSDKDEFILNENASLEMIDSLSYYCKNSNQEKALKAINTINDKVDELIKLGFKECDKINLAKVFPFVRRIKSK